MSKKVICLISFVLACALSGSISLGQENQIVNGEFDNGLLAWGSYGSAGFTSEVVAGAGLSGSSAALIDITNASAATSIGISQGISQLVEGETYPLGFIAKSDQEREMVVLIQLHKPEGEQWIDIVLERVALTTEPQKFFIEYTHVDESTEDHPDWSVNMYLMLKGAWWGMVGDDLNTKVWIDWVYFGAEPEVQSRGRAVNPSPDEGDIVEDTWVNLTWFPGDFAVSHDVYLGENFDDVNNGLGDTFRGNRPSTSFIVGFPGFPYPDGLVPGTTYYWRIDEVNDADPNSPWKGPVWSFRVPSRIAYDPSPPDGAKFVDPNVIFSWAPGFGSKLHTIFFGENFDDVNNAVVGLPQAETTYRPGTLELEKKYYWRIDEFSGAATEKGDVWSFTVTKAGGGLKAEYFNNRTLSGEPILTRLDPEIDFNWGSADEPGRNSPDASINVDNFSARWSGELEVDLTDTYIFQITADNGFRLWLDGKTVIDFWNNGATNDRQSEPIELVSGDTHSIQMEYFEGVGTAVAQLFWESSRRQQQIIPSGALQPPLKAGGPSPSSGAVDVTQIQVLSWRPGDNTTSHQVYFGTDGEAVKNANTDSPEYKGTRNLGSESYDAGQLEWGTTYYWRVDEVKDDSTIQKGNIWSFTTANFIIVDDFEDYDAGDNQIWFTWHDGFGFGTPGTEGYFAGNGTGSMVGDETTGSYTEETIVHGGSQSMPVFYDNSVLRYSEVEMTLTYPRDWTENGVSTLSIWFRGDSDNAAETLYVALNGITVVNHDNPNAAQIDEWTQWDIDLQAFGVNLTNVNTIALGLGNKNNPQAGGSGTMYFDDIRLYAPLPEPEPEAP
jgi:hypothetical protein